MNNLTTLLEDFKTENISKFLKQELSNKFSDLIIRLSNLEADNDAQSSYQLEHDQLLNIIAYHEFERRITNIMKSRTAANAIQKLLCMYYPSSQRDLDTVLDILAGVVDKRTPKTEPFLYFIPDDAAEFREHSWDLTNNKDCAKMIWEWSFEYIRNAGPEMELEYFNFEQIGPALIWAFGSIRNTKNPIVKQMILESLEEKNDTKDYFYPDVQKYKEYFLLMKDAGKLEQLYKDFTSGKMATLTERLFYSIGMETKEDVFEMLNEIEDRYTDYYESSFGIPFGETLTDDEYVIYGNYLQKTRLSNKKQVSIELAQREFDFNVLSVHPDFKLTMAKGAKKFDKMELIKLLNKRNFTQDEIQEAADLFTLNDFYDAAERGILSEETFNKIENDIGTDFDYRQYKNDTVDSRLAAHMKSVINNKTNITLKLLTDIQKIYNTQALNVINEVDLKSDFVDDKVRRAKLALESLYK